jgi:predicted short-subunit dehydrogenase-like oxidoreductase (DUF2520 family)
MRPSVSIIGAGRAGIAIGLALKAAAYRIEAVVTKHPATARRAARLIDPQTQAATEAQLAKPNQRQRSLLTRASIFIISTPDDAIESVAKRLAAIFKDRAIGPHHGASTRRVALHTSGALSSKSLNPLRQAGFAVGSLHPLLSISDPQTGASLLKRAFFSVEGDPPAVRQARSIVRDLGGQVFSLPADAKPLYHAAASIASPHLIALFDIALDVLSSAGVSRRRAQKILIPLVESTLDNLKRQSPARALTGPFKRRDTATIRKHIAALQSADLRDALAAYALLGRRSLAMAETRTTDNPSRDTIVRILSACLTSKV